MIEQLWQYKIQVIPVLLFLAVYEVPAFLRRLRKIYYVPIYFSVYPLREINQDLSKYLAEDYFLCEGFDLDKEQLETLRKRIIITSVISATIDALVVPLLIGVMAAFVLNSELFYQFIAVLVIYKIISIIFSLRNSHLHILNSKWKNSLLIVIYIAYVGIIAEMLRTAYEWAVPYIVASDWSGMFSSFSTFFFGTILAQGMLFAFLVAIFSNFIADRRLREENVSSDE